MRADAILHLTHTLRKVILQEMTHLYLTHRSHYIGLFETPHCVKALVVTLGHDADILRPRWMVFGAYSWHVYCGYQTTTSHQSV